MALADTYELLAEALFAVVPALAFRVRVSPDPPPSHARPGSVNARAGLVNARSSSARAREPLAHETRRVRSAAAARADEAADARTLTKPRARVDEADALPALLPATAPSGHLGEYRHGPWGGYTEAEPH